MTAVVSPFSLVFSRVSADNYPQLKPYAGTIGEYPGLVFLEKHWFQASRHTVSVAMFASPIWWLFRRSRLPSQLRPNYRLHHVILQAGGYGLCAGLVIGVGLCLFNARRFTMYNEMAHEAVRIRSNKQLDRWNRTGGRLGAMGATTMMVFSNAGSLPLRIVRGAGVGLFLAIPVSFTELDVALSLL